MNGKKSAVLESIRLAILAMAEIRAATDAFERGEVNVHDALDTIAATVEACRDARAEHRLRERRQRAS